MKFWIPAFAGMTKERLSGTFCEFIKSHLSEYISRSAHGHERFVISRRGRAVAALVSVEDLRIIEQHEERRGLAAIAGGWPGFSEVADGMGDLSELRQRGGGGRDVSL